MGIVSTALSEEELSKCLKISIYKPLHMKEQEMRGDWCLNDTKCTICQVIFLQVSYLPLKGGNFDPPLYRFTKKDDSFCNGIVSVTHGSTL